MSIRGLEFHSIIENIFNDVKNINVSEQLSINCPYCADRNNNGYPDDKYNLEINTAQRIFHCWSCDEPKFSGSLGKLIRIFGSDSDYKIYKSYALLYPNYYEDNDEERELIQVKLPSEMIFFSQMDSNNPEHFEAYSYLVIERLIARDIILKYRLGFCVTGRYSKRIIIPSYDENGEINYFVSRTYDSKEKKKYDNPKSDKSKIIFNEGYINWDSTVFLCEGVFDMFSLPNAIPLLGKTISPKLFLKLKELKPHVIILLDPDAYKNAIDLYYSLYNIYIGYEERVKIVKLPTKDDIDNFRKKNGIDCVINCLYTARGLTVDDYFVNKLQKPYDNNRTGRYQTYSKYFNRKY